MTRKKLSHTLVAWVTNQTITLTITSIEATPKGGLYAKGISPDGEPIVTKIRSEWGLASGMTVEIVPGLVITTRAGHQFQQADCYLLSVD